MIFFSLILKGASSKPPGKLIFLLLELKASNLGYLIIFGFPLTYKVSARFDNIDIRRFII
jgi:hypothetical protein